MRLRVADINKTLDRIRATTAAFKGQIDDLQVSTESNTPIYRPYDDANAGGETVPLGAYVTVRVPSDRLAEFSKRVAAFGTVLHESANQADVTQQRIDLAARLRNLRAEEVRLRQFLDAAKNVKEMLLVETELSRVRSEIESMQSQLDYLDKQISYGTLTVELQKPAPVVRPTGTDWGFAQAITNGIRGAAAAMRSFITIAIALSPLIVLGVVALLIMRWVIRRRNRNRTRGGTPASEWPTPAEGAADEPTDSGEVSGMSALHPTFKMPLWAALALPVAAYLYRSISRGFDFGLDMPTDAVAFTIFAVAFGAVVWSRRMAAQPGDQEPPNEEDHERDEPGDEGQHHEVVRDV